MVWTAPKIRIREINGETRHTQTQSMTRWATISVVATGLDTSEQATQFVLVRAADATRGLEGPDVIPCHVRGQPTTSYGPHGEQLHTFTLELSVHQRQAGSYHLIAYFRADEDAKGRWVNNVTVYEHALVIEGLGAEELEQARAEAEAEAAGG